MKKVCFLFLVLSILSTRGRADFNWNAELGNWADGANWDKGFKPDGSEHVNLPFSGTSVCTLNTAEGPFSSRLVIRDGQTLNIEDGGSVGFAWSRVGRNTAAFVNMSGNGSFLMNNDDLYIGLENGYCEWTLSDSSSIVINVDADDGEELYIGEDGGTGLFTLIGSNVTVNVDRIRLTANNPGGTAVMKFVLDAGGASTISCQRSYIGEAGDAHLMLSTIAQPPAEDIVLVHATSSYDIGGTGVFNTLNGGPAAEGTLLVLGGNVYSLSYAYDADEDFENNDLALVFIKQAKNLAHSPNPADRSTVSSSPLTLSWTLPDPNDGVSPVSCDVYFGADPNRPQMDKVSLTAGISSVEINTDNFPTYGIQPLPDANDFYWVVDCHDPSADPDAGLGFYWSFSTDYNEAPIVDAGPDQVSWIGKSGTADQETINLTGAVSDDGNPDPPGAVSILWTQVSGPASTVISPENATSASVTITVAGIYTFRLTADDTDKQSSDTVDILVGSDSCHASFLDGAAYDSMDFNEDCIVNLEDFADFAAAWMNCTNTQEACY